tara:strand:- start:934 stop:1143 length:210 start_codon:yes stop_codon:yes gene_type:complete
MCMSPKVPQAPVQPTPPMPVRADQAQDLSPELVKASDADLNIKKKKIKKSGTSSLNTSSGLNIATSSSI